MTLWLNRLFRAGDYRRCLAHGRRLLKAGGLAPGERLRVLVLVERCRRATGAVRQGCSARLRLISAAMLRAAGRPQQAVEEAFRALQDAEKAAAGEAYTDTGYVVVNELGMPLNTRHLREYAYRLMRRLGLRQVRLYDARHSVLKALALAGVPDVILAAWAGHTNAAFTKRKYVSIEAEDMRDAAAALDSFHGALSEPPREIL